MTVLTLKNVGVNLGGKQVVQNMNLRLGSGQVVGLIGPNGAGKSTLMKAIAGVLTSEGSIRLDEKNVTALGNKERARLISYLAQEKVAHWPLSVREIAMLGRPPHLATFESPSEADMDAVDQVLEQTDMRALADRSILELSGGEQARAFLSRALAVQAPVLLADEPIAALDPAHQLEIMALLQSYARSGALVLVIMHDLSLATRYCDELVLLDKGELVAHGEASTVLSDRHLQQVYGIEVARGTKDDDVFVVPWRRLTD